jgi:metal-dependent amidase/aminoacylase/carboxypeptidase family protein
MERVDLLVEKYQETVLEHYRWLHQHPEVSGQEKESAAYIAAALRKIGLVESHSGGSSKAGLYLFAAALLITCILLLLVFQGKL